MKNNQMKCKLINNEMQFVEWSKTAPTVLISVDDNLSELSNNLGYGYSWTKVTKKVEGVFEVIDINAIKKHWKKMKKDWFGAGEVYTTRAVGVFWIAFMTYIFPWMLDIAKVYCAFMVAQGFYKENKGGGKDGRTGFQSLVHYGKWYVAFYLIPVAVELIDQVGFKMMTELKNQPLGN